MSGNSRSRARHALRLSRRGLRIPRRPRLLLSGPVRLGCVRLPHPQRRRRPGTATLVLRRKHRGQWLSRRHSRYRCSVPARRATLRQPVREPVCPTLPRWSLGTLAAGARVPVSREHGRASRVIQPPEPASAPPTLAPASLVPLAPASLVPLVPPSPPDPLVKS